MTKDTWHGVPDDPQSLNRYAYAGGDPVNLVDPSGHYWVLIARGAVVAVKVGVRVVKSGKYARQVGNGVAKVGELHHIASNKSIKSGFTEAYEKIFAKAGMTLQHSTNKIFLEGHKGAHTNKYKQYVLDYLTNATKGLSGTDYKNALVKGLDELGKQLLKDPKMPYKGGM